MSFPEIVKELPKLSRSERRELARRLFEVEDDEASLLAECDRRADERFQMLDAMEAQDGPADSR
jgi:hypothetical protein